MKFTGPFLKVKRGRPDDLWWNYRPAGQTVIKKDGQWRTIMGPQEDFLRSCEVVLRGGYTHTINETLAAELTAAGYGQYISED